MAKSNRHPLSELNNYLPEGTFDAVVAFLQHYKVQLTITRARRSILGDYRNAHGGHGHRISVNGNLNPYAFLITLLHELAHLVTYEKYRHRVQPHGREWKDNYAQILSSFLAKNVFPADIAHEINSSLHNLGASSCSEPGLMRVLKKYDEDKIGLSLIEEIAPGEWFVTRDNKVFQMVNKRRTRYLCTAYPSGKQYLFNALYEVKKIEAPSGVEGNIKPAILEQEPSNGTPQLLIKELEPGQWFITHDRLIFQVVKKMRTRYLCTAYPSKKQYSFQANYPVTVISPPNQA